MGYEFVAKRIYPCATIKKMRENFGSISHSDPSPTAASRFKMVLGLEYRTTADHANAWLKKRSRELTTAEKLHERIRSMTPGEWTTIFLAGLAIIAAFEAKPTFDDYRRPPIAQSRRKALSRV